MYAVIEKNKDASAEVICKEIEKDVALFAGETSQFDDIAMLSLKYNGSEVIE